MFKNQPDNSSRSWGMWLAVFAVLIALPALWRLVPHPPNLTPIGAVALFSGAVFFDRRIALLCPLLAMFLSDLFIEFDASRLWVYTSLGVIALHGHLLLSKRRSAGRVVIGSFSASLHFFVITNFGVWLMSGWYGHSLNELARCYAMAIPFFDKTLMGDLIFSGVLFGGFALLESRITSQVPSAVES